MGVMPTKVTFKIEQNSTPTNVLKNNDKIVT
jgi:hypothetical protein